MPDAYSTLDQRGRRNTLDDTLDRSDRETPQVTHTCKGTPSPVQLQTTNNLFSLNFPHKQLSTPDISKPTHYTTWNVLLTYCDFTNNTRRGLTSTNSLTRPSSIITHLFNAFSLSFFLCQSLFLWLSGRNVWGEAGLFASVGLLWWLGHSPSPPTQCMSTHGMCVHLLHGLHVDI